MKIQNVYSQYKMDYKTIIAGLLRPVKQSHLTFPGLEGRFHVRQGCIHIGSCQRHFANTLYLSEALINNKTWNFVN